MDSMLDLLVEVAFKAIDTVWMKLKWPERRFVMPEDKRVRDPSSTFSGTTRGVCGRSWEPEVLGSTPRSPIVFAG